MVKQPTFSTLAVCCAIRQVLGHSLEGGAGLEETNIPMRGLSDVCSDISVQRRGEEQKLPPLPCISFTFPCGTWEGGNLQGFQYGEEVRGVSNNGQSDLRSYNL